MDYINAVKAMKNGKKVRRKLYSNNIFEIGGILIYVNKRELEKMNFLSAVEFCNDNYIIHLEDIEATDWEVVEEKTLADKRLPHSFNMYRERDIKRALKEFIDIITTDILIDTSDDVRLFEKAKEIFGKELIGD